MTDKKKSARRRIFYPRGNLCRAFTPAGMKKS